MSGYTDAMAALNALFGETSLGTLDSTEVKLVLESGAKKIIDIYHSGTVGNSGVVLTFVAPVAMTFKAGLADSAAEAGTGATAEAVFDIKTDGGAAWGTITFAAAGTTGTFAAAADEDVAAGSLVTITGPATGDATLADIAFSLTGYC